MSFSGDSNYSFSKEHYCIYICNTVAIFVKNDIVLFTSSFMRSSARPNSGNKGMFRLPPVPLVLYQKVREPSQTSSPKNLSNFQRTKSICLQKITKLGYRNLFLKNFLGSLFKKLRLKWNIT